jgi:shikimate dehydrogenase
VLVGHPVAHSLSPRFQNAALRAAGLALAYDAVDVPPAALGRTLEALGAERAAGNVTVPHKEAVADRCARLTPLAESAGAVNTFWHDAAGRLVGDNTDVGGFDEAVRALVSPDATAQRVALVGAGGSAAAVVAAVAAWPGASLTVWSRTPARARALASARRTTRAPARPSTHALDGATLVVNATPLGLGPGTPSPSRSPGCPTAAPCSTWYTRPRGRRGCGRRPPRGTRPTTARDAVAPGRAGVPPLVRTRRGPRGDVDRARRDHGAAERDAGA